MPIDALLLAGSHTPLWGPDTVDLQTSTSAPAAVGCLWPRVERSAAAAGKNAGAGGGAQHAPMGLHQTLSVAANRIDAGAWAAEAWARGSNLAREGAYLHWLDKFGTSKEDVLGALEEMRVLADDYAALERVK